MRQKGAALTLHRKRLATPISLAVGFGGGMILLPVITYFYGIEVAVPVATIAQLMSNLSRVGIGWKDIHWRAAGRFTLVALPLTALGAFGFAKVPKAPMTIILCTFLIAFAIIKHDSRISVADYQQSGNIVIVVPSHKV